MTLNQFNGSERRAYVRLKKSMPVRLKISENQTSQNYTATTQNISQGGLCIEIQHNQEGLKKALAGAKHKIGIDINTLIPQPNEAHSEMSQWVSGRVDWARELNQPHQTLLLGIEFENLPEMARTRIRDYLLDQFLHKYPQQE